MCIVAYSKLEKQCFDFLGSSYNIATFQINFITYKNHSYPFIILNIHKLSLSLSLSLKLKSSIITFHVHYSIPSSASSTSPPPPFSISISNHGVFNLLVLVMFSLFGRLQKQKLELFHLVRDNTVCWIFLLLLCFAFLFNHFILLFGYGFALESLNVKYDYNYFVLILMSSLSHNFTISVMLIYHIDCISKNQY